MHLLLKVDNHNKKKNQTKMIQVAKIIRTGLAITGLIVTGLGFGVVFGSIVLSTITTPALQPLGMCLDVLLFAFLSYKCPEFRVYICICFVVFFIYIIYFYIYPESFVVNCDSFSPRQISNFKFRLVNSVNDWMNHVNNNVGGLVTFDNLMSDKLRSDECNFNQVDHQVFELLWITRMGNLSTATPAFYSNTSIYDKSTQLAELLS